MIVEEGIEQSEEQNGMSGGSSGVLLLHPHSLGSKSAKSAPVRSAMDVLLKNGKSAFLPRAGELAEGTVLERKNNRLFVDLGPRGVGIVYGREYYAAQDVIKKMEPGDAISAKVLETDNEDGYIELSLKEAGEEKRWFDIKEAKDSGQTIELPVLEANRGGLILEYRGVQGFLPASQLSSAHYPRVDGGDKEKIFQELQKLVNTPLVVKILDLDQRESKLIFTEKNLNSEELQTLLEKYSVGDVVKGEITGVVDFGAFMKLEDSLEGLIHISEIDWSLVENPRDVLKQGDTVEAKIIEIQGDKVALSLKALKKDPWEGLEERYNTGDIVKGTVTKLNPFGAFVQLAGEEVQGLVHISEFGNEEQMTSQLSAGSDYSFLVQLVDPKEHRISLKLVSSDASSGTQEVVQPDTDTDEKSADNS